MQLELWNDEDENLEDENDDDCDIVTRAVAEMTGQLQRRRSLQTDAVELHIPGLENLFNKNENSQP